MYFSGIFLNLFLTVSCLVGLGLSLRCLTCASPQDCKKPQLLECTPFLANNTRSQLNTYHEGVNMNVSSYAFNCLQEEIKGGFGDIHYRGCIYDNIHGCNLRLRPQFAASNQRKCKQCQMKDACNSSENIFKHLLEPFIHSMVIVTDVSKGVTI
uniref:Protein sleepless n=1 Tax=Glossina brevipalpis TaxID=37001 RepID=A0A1A9WPH9_9MUSC